MHKDAITCVSKKLFFVFDTVEEYPVSIYTCDKDLIQLLDFLANKGFVGLLLTDELSGWKCYGIWGGE